MKIKLSPKHPQLEALNATTAHGREFAEFLRELKQKRDLENIGGSFTIFQGRGGVILELDFKTKKQGS